MNKIIYNLLLICLGCLLPDIILAKANSHIILDRNLFAYGDVLRGAILFDHVSVNEKVVRANVFNLTDKSQVIQSFYIKISKNVGHFYLPISLDFSSGSYVLEFESLILQEKPRTQFIGSSFFTTLTGSMKEQSLMTKKITPSNSHLNKDISISSLEGYVTDLDNIDISDLLMIAVVDTTYELDVNSFEFLDWDQGFVDSWSNKIFKSMNVKNELGQTKFNLLGLYSSDVNRTFVCKSNDQGEAYFLLSDFEGNQDFQILYSKLETPSIQFESTKSDYVYEKPLFENVLSLRKDMIIKTADAHKYFGIRQYQIDSVRSKKDFLPLTPQKVFEIKHYKKFPDFESFCLENSLPLKFVQNKDDVSLELKPNAIYTKNYETIWRNPLVLLNDQILEDYRGLKDLLMSEVEKIEMYYDTKALFNHFSAYGNNGLIKIYLKKSSKFDFTKKYSTNVFGFQPSIKSVEQIVSDANQLMLPYLGSTNAWYSSPSLNKLPKFEFNSTRNPKYLYLVYIKDASLKVKKILLSDH